MNAKTDRQSREDREAVVALLRAGSCVRAPSKTRLKEESYREYKKGWEVRFYADSKEHAARIGRTLGRAGLAAGRPYQKSADRWILPLYGREAVAELLQWNESI